jgi:hypothetical protein
MIASNFFIKNLVSIFTIAVISFFSVTAITAQCEGTYFKPTGRTITDPQVYISSLQEQFAGDLNGDGKLDLVATNINSPVNFNKLFIYPGDGAGGFGARTEINLPGPLRREYGSHFLEDFNGDNKTDLIVQYSSNVSSNVLVYLNNGAGAFTPLTPTAISGEVINLADVNNDKLRDLITLGGSIIYYQLANADGSFGALVQFPQATFVGRHEGDFDGDGDMDFASLDYSGAIRTFRIVVNQGNGSFSVSNPLVSLDTSDFFFDAVTDLNNDGRPDIVLTNYGNAPKITILLNQGNNNFTKTSYNNATSPVNSFTRLGDFNGDGFTDFFNLTHTQPGTFARGYLVSLNNGGGAFAQRSYSFGGLDSYDDRPVGDFNGDRKTDFIRINNAGQSAGTFPSNVFNETQFTVKTNVCGSFGQSKLVDFNRDRRTDLTVWRASDGRWRFQHPNSGNFPGTPAGTFYWGAPNDKPVPGDYDGDGATDYAVFRPSNGFWYIRNSSNNSLTAVQFGASTDKPVPADYNGDGRTDIAVFRLSNGTWYFLTSGTNQFSARQFGVAEDVPVPEDYDGDERADIAVFRPSQGSWYILRSSNNSFYGVQWGLGTDDPHPADYDGDGKADISVRRKSNNYWYILRSYNNQMGAIQFGVTEDIAQTGDWDGNSIMDIGVYRPSTRFWYATSEAGLYLGRLGEPDEISAASVSR